MAACLRKAKKHLAANAAEYGTGKSAMVCYALRDTRSVWSGLLQQWVSAQLDGCAGLGTWLERVHPELRTKLLLETNPTLWRDKIQATRHAWVDHMIKTLES